MDVREFREILHEDIALAAGANLTNQEEEFLNYVTDILISAEEFDDFIECYYDGISKRRANMRIDGYAMDDTDGSCCVFISDYHGPHEDDSIRNEDIASMFKKIRYFIEEAVRYGLYRELEESTHAYEFARRLSENIDDITKFRFFLLTDAFNKQRTKNIKDEKLADKLVELNVWDISRLFDLVSSKTQKESVEIFLPERGYEGIPCVKAVEYHDVVADIDAPPKYDENPEGAEPQKPENIEENMEILFRYLSNNKNIETAFFAHFYFVYIHPFCDGNGRTARILMSKIEGRRSNDYGEAWRIECK